MREKGAEIRFGSFLHTHRRAVWEGKGKQWRCLWLRILFS